MKYNNIKIISALILTVVVIVVGIFFITGRPNFDRVYPGGRLYSADLFSENLYVYASFDFKKMALKSNSLLDERIKEAIYMSGDKDRYGDAEYSVFKTAVDKNIDRSNHLCSKIKNQNIRDDCYAQLFEKILTLSDIIYSVTENADLANGFVDKSVEALDQISSEEKKKEATKANSEKIKTLSALSEELKSKTAEHVDTSEASDNESEDTPQDDTSEPAKTSEYLPIDNIDKSALDGVIRSVNNDRSYLISKINCYREKGFISAMIVDREEADSGLGSDNVGVLIFVNTDGGLKPVNFDIFEYDLEGYFNTIPELSENLTYEEFEELLPDSGDEGKFTPIGEAEINYY